jgi:hypothetical protein
VSIPLKYLNAVKLHILSKYIKNAQGVEHLKIPKGIIVEVLSQKGEYRKPYP